MVLKRCTECLGGADEGEALKTIESFIWLLHTMSKLVRGATSPAV